MSTEDPDRLEMRERQILWVSGYYREQAGVKPGDFYTFLIQAFFRADRDNFRRLEMGFPLTAQAYKNYMVDGLQEKYGLKD